MVSLVGQTERGREMMMRRKKWSEIVGRESICEGAGEEGEEEEEEEKEDDATGHKDEAESGGN